MCHMSKSGVLVSERQRYSDWLGCINLIMLGCICPTRRFTRWYGSRFALERDYDRMLLIARTFAKQRRLKLSTNLHRVTQAKQRDARWTFRIEQAKHVFHCSALPIRVFRMYWWARLWRPARRFSLLHRHYEMRALGISGWQQLLVSLSTEAIGSIE